MNTTGGVILGATVAGAGTVGVVHGPTWAIHLLVTILGAMLCTAFRLAGTVAEGPPDRRPPLPQLTPRPAAHLERGRGRALR